MSGCMLYNKVKESEARGYPASSVKHLCCIFSGLAAKAAVVAAKRGRPARRSSRDEQRRRSAEDAGERRSRGRSPGNEKPWSLGGEGCTYSRTAPGVKGTRAGRRDWRAAILIPWSLTDGRRDASSRRARRTACFSNKRPRPAAHIAFHLFFFSPFSFPVPATGYF